MADDDDRDGKLGTKLETEPAAETRDVYLSDGRTLSVARLGVDELVEIRSSSGQVEVRILLTEKGPVLQMEAVRLQLRAEEAVEIESKRVGIKASETIDVEAEGDVRVKGEKIWLN